MKIGIPKEIKNNEYRVGATPTYVESLIKHGHQVFVESGAGEGSGYSNSDYEKAGAIIFNLAKEVYAESEMIIKIKEPQPEEFSLIKKGQILFTYFHFSSSLSLTKAMIKSGAICIAYETITDNLGRLPLLIPMSEIAGRVATQQGAYFLGKPQGGSGVLLGGIPGAKRGNVTVIGGGVVGRNAAIIAAGLQANVEILDINSDVLRSLSIDMPMNVVPLYSSRENLIQSISKADLIIGAVLVPGAVAPKILSKEDLKYIKKGSVLVDVAIDQGGCFETSKPTTHQNPIFEVDGIIHYCVTNMPGSVPATATTAITTVSLPYALEIANKGWKQAVSENNHLSNGLNISNGLINYKAIKEAFNSKL